MKMSLPPRATARSRSWCTSWKSRVAIAVADHERRGDVDHQLRQGQPGLDRSPRDPPARRAASARRPPGRTRPGPAARSAPAPGRCRAARRPCARPRCSCTSATTIGSCLARHRRVVVHHVAVHLAGAGGHDVPGPAPRRTPGTSGPGGWRSAPQPPQRWIRSSPAAVPSQKNAVSRETDRPQHVARRLGRRLVAAPAGTSGSGTASSRPARCPTYQVLRVVTNQPSPSDGPLRAGHALQAGPHRDLLAGPQVAGVLLLAVGGDDRGEPGLVEHRGHQAERVVVVAAGGCSPRMVQTCAIAGGATRPPCTDRVRGLGVGVDRVGVADRLGPVAGSSAGSPDPGPRAGWTRPAAAIRAAAARIAAAAPCGPVSSPA